MMRLRWSTVGVMASLLLSIAGCASTGSSSSASGSAAATGSGSSAFTSCSSDAASKFFPSIAGKKLVIGMDATLPPYESVDKNDPTKIVGLDPDLLDAVFGCLGLTYQLQNMATDALVPALQNGRIDVIWSGLFVTPERAAKVTFVTYLHANDGADVAKGNPHHIQSLDDICGLRAAIVTGYAEAPLVTGQSDKCVAAGKAAVEISSYDTEDACVRALQNGRADIFITDDVSAKNHAEQFPTAIEMSFIHPSAYPFGVGVAKSNTDLANAIAQALQIVQSAGTERTLLTKWGFLPTTQVAPQIISK